MVSPVWSARPPSQAARVGAVVPCKNEVVTLRSCLVALRKQQPALTPIIVVDNGSTDGSLEVARELADEVLEIREGRISGLRNAGARRCRDVDALAFVDADTEIAPGWLEAGLTALQTCDLVGSRSLAASDAGWVARRWAAIEAGQVRPESPLWSQQLLIKRSVFDRLGGFDERLTTNEDGDLSRRVVATGGRTALEPAMLAIHHGFPANLRNFSRRERWHTSTPGWYAVMSRKSRLLVGGVFGWLCVGAGIAAVTTRQRTPGLAVSWLLCSVVAIPALGALTADRPRTGRSWPTTLQDGALIAIWAGLRALRLPAEARRAGRNSLRRAAP